MAENIFGMLPDELKNHISQSLGHPRYRADQLLDSVYRKYSEDFSGMTLLPAELRETLPACFSLYLPVIRKKLVSEDGTVKYLLELEDKVLVESVFIPEEERKTVCFSTQAGCALGCSFCATGRGGFKRNLTAAEIVGQLVRIRLDSGTTINNAVAMGQGEPFLNIEAVKKALEILTHPKCLGMSRRHITVSTAGIVPGITACADESFPCRLAVSLHSAKNPVRDVLVPINKKYPLEEMKKALRYYADLTRNRITFEYILIDNVNDSGDDAAALADFINGLPAFVNLIPFNATGTAPYARPSEKRMAAFAENLSRTGIEACVRREKGADIRAACGQLTQQIFNG